MRRAHRGTRTEARALLLRALPGHCGCLGRSACMAAHAQVGPVLRLGGAAFMLTEILELVIVFSMQTGDGAALSAQREGSR